MTTLRFFLVVFVLIAAGCTSTSPDEPEDPVPCGKAWDADGDNMGNDEELGRGLDPCNPDTDGDGIEDWNEVYRNFTDPTDSDTDGDTLTDGEDPAPLDASHDEDGDGVLDQYDLWWGENFQVGIEVIWTSNNSNGWYLYLNNQIYSVLPESFWGNSSDYSLTPQYWDWHDNSTKIIGNLTTWNDGEINEVVEIELNADYTAEHRFILKGNDWDINFFIRFEPKY